MTIGQRAVEEIRVYARNKGIDKSELPKELETHKSNLKNWERGHCDPGAFFLAKMDAFGCDIHYILTGDRSDGKTVYTECDKGQPPL